MKTDKINCVYYELDHARRLIPSHFEILECINVQKVLSFQLEKYNIKSYKFPRK